MLAMWTIKQTYMPYEPWWLFDDWETFVVETFQFDNKQQFIDKLTELDYYLKQENDHSLCKGNMKAYWKENDTYFCVECDDDLQQYTGLILLKDGQIMK